MSPQRQHSRAFTLRLNRLKRRLQYATTVPKLAKAPATTLPTTTQPANAVHAHIDNKQRTHLVRYACSAQQCCDTAQTHQSDRRGDNVARGKNARAAAAAGRRGLDVTFDAD